MTISFCVAFFASIVIVSEPTNVNFNLVGEFNSIEYLPSASVTPSVLPSLFVTATPIIGSPLSSTTLPCTVNAWARAVCDMARNARIMEAFKNLFSFIIRFFILVCLCFNQYSQRGKACLLVVESSDSGIGACAYQSYLVAKL